MQVFGDKLKLSHITAVPQAHLRPRLIINLSDQPDKETPSVNDTMNREISPESIQFGISFPCIIQAIWEEDPEEGTSQSVKTQRDRRIPPCQCSTLQLSQVGEFAYVVPAVPEDDVIIICIDLVLPMGWVDRLNFFCAFWETTTNMVNA